MGSRGPEKGQVSKYNPAEIAKVALEAYRQGQSMAVVGRETTCTWGSASGPPTGIANTTRSGVRVYSP